MKSQLCQQSDNYSPNTARADPPLHPYHPSPKQTYQHTDFMLKQAKLLLMPTHQHTDFMLKQAKLLPTPTHQHTDFTNFPGAATMLRLEKRSENSIVPLVLVEILSCIHRLGDSDKSKQVRQPCSLQVSLLSCLVCVCVCVLNKLKPFFKQNIQNQQCS